MNERAKLYNFFGSLFLDLPSIELVQKMRQFESMEAIDEGTKLIQQYALSKKDESDEDVLQELAVDRTYLMRGTTKVGPRPPYEMLYSNGSNEEGLGEINKIYQDSMMKIDLVLQERPDYLGIELRFMAQLCENESQDITASQDMQKKFIHNHLGSFAIEYTKEINKFARTGFYLGIGCLMNDFISSEMELSK